MSAAEAAATEGFKHLTRLIEETAAASEARSCATEAASLARSLEFSRQIDERAQVVETLAATFCSSAVAELAQRLEQRAQLAEQCAKAFASQVVHDTMAKVSSANDESLFEIAHANEARAQATEAAAQAYADVGLSALAASLAAASRSMQGRAKELSEAIQSIQDRLGEHQERAQAEGELCAVLDRTVLFERASIEAEKSSAVDLYKAQSKTGEISPEVTRPTVSANHDVGVSRSISG